MKKTYHKIRDKLFRPHFGGAAIIASIFLLSLTILPEIATTYADCNQGDDNSFTVSINLPIGILGNNTNVQGTVIASHGANFTFTGLGTPKVSIWIGRSIDVDSSGTPTISATMTPPSTGIDQYNYNFTYNQSTFTTTTEDQQLGYNFEVMASVTVGSKTQCNIITVPINNLYSSVKITAPMMNQCFSSNPITITILDQDKIPGNVHSIFVTGPAYSKRYDVPVANFGTSTSYSLTIDPLNQSNIGTFTVDVKTKINATDPDNTMKDGGQINFGYHISDYCNAGPFTKYPVLSPGESMPYFTGTTSMYHVLDFEKAFKIEPHILSDHYHIPPSTTTCNSDQYYVVRDQQVYTMDWGDNTSMVWTRDQLNTLERQYHAYSATGTYTFNYSVTYRERVFDGQGGEHTCSGFPRTPTVSLLTYTVTVADTKIQPASQLDKVASNSIQDAFTLCNNQNGGDIFINNSQNNTTNNVIDFSSMITPVRLYVKDPSGYIINGQSVGMYYPGARMADSKQTINGLDWYSVLLPNITVPLNRFLDGNTDNWPNPFQAGDQLTITNSTCNSGSTANFSAGNSIFILPETYFNYGSNVTLTINPSIY